MQPERTEHFDAVEAWLEPAASLPGAELLALFERAVRALWQRAQRALGEITLAAIAERVLVTTSEQCELLTNVRVREGVIDFEPLQRADVPAAEELLRAMRLVLVELLTVLGTLTGEILTPALHAELATVTFPRGPGGGSHEQSGRKQRPAGDGTDS